MLFELLQVRFRFVNQFSEEFKFVSIVTSSGNIAERNIIYEILLQTEVWWSMKTKFQLPSSAQ